MKIIGYILIALIVVVLVLFFILGRKSQSMSPLGLINTSLAACPKSPNCVSSEAGTPEDKTVKPFALTDLEQVRAALSSMGGEEITNQDGYQAFIFKSKTFGFIDDVELRADGDVLHIRSASRVGYSDRGVNRARIAALRAKL